MATSKVVKPSNKRVILNLSEIEAKYLHDALQNCPFTPPFGTENAVDQESRSAIWCELNNCLEAE